MKIKISKIISFILIFFILTSCTNNNGNDNEEDDIKLWKKIIPSDYKISEDWDNAIVYFVFTDRFYNGDTSNDLSYGRESLTNTSGHFYGGDLKGLTYKINEGYFNDLTVDAIWITAPYEQIHGWVVGDSNKFKHYSYHGYYALDFTKLDANMGDENELKEFIDTAHSRGIKVIFDVVMNHPGYSNIKDLSEQIPNVLKTGWESATLTNYHTLIDYSHIDWFRWWGANWIRAGLGPEPRDGIDGRYYEFSGGDPLYEGVGYLPDFYTEKTRYVGLPDILKNKVDTNAIENQDFTVRDYIISWLIDWVREYGVDGFRCDTAKHVELSAWNELKIGATYALREWKKNNPSKKIDDSDFWMTGEVWGYGSSGLSRNDYFISGGFNSLINFDFQSKINNSVLTDPQNIESTYSLYSTSINNVKDFNVLSYLSSHDTFLFFSGGRYPKNTDTFYPGASSIIEKQKLAGSLLLLCPGAIQIFYGDECARERHSYPSGTDEPQRTRSKMIFSGDDVWNTDKESTLTHWSIMTKFRKKHIAIGAGAHAKIADVPYTFSRIKDTDKVICVIDSSGATEVSVSGVFNDGEVLTDFYTGDTATVSSGKVTFTAHQNGVILIEK
ncbi:MAG: alpha-amylase [Spirochaetes bacterium]|nr:alpha-amylase [Spirochaetota bacterium]